jgi:hypothetical protein
VIYAGVAKFLVQMLNAVSRAKYDEAFLEVEKILRPRPAKLAYIRSFYNKPHNIALFHILTVRGSMRKRGGSHAEQNHSSIESRISKGAAMEPEVLVKMLLDRQGELVATRKSRAARHLVTSYAQAKRLPEGAFQRNALLSLSKHAYTNFFKPGFTQMDQYEYRDCVVEGKPGKQVRHISKPWDVAQIILDGERCRGESCVTFNTQCIHEMKSHGEFRVEKWGTRHLQDIVYEHRHALQTEG